MSNGSGFGTFGGVGTGSQGASGGAGASYVGSIGRITWRSQPQLIPWQGMDLTGSVSDWKSVTVPVQIPLYKIELMLNGVLMSVVAMGVEDIPTNDFPLRYRYPTTGYLAAPLSAQEQEDIRTTFGADATMEQRTIRVIENDAFVNRVIYIITRTMKVPFYDAASLETQAKMTLRFSTETTGRLRLIWGGIIIRDWDISGIT